MTVAHQLLSPKRKCRNDTLPPQSVRDNRSGGYRSISLTDHLDDGYRTMPAELKILQTGETNEVLVIIQEGKFHQIKRMFQALGKRVVYLKGLGHGRIDSWTPI